jgi:hypothetical protein
MNQSDTTAAGATYPKVMVLDVGGRCFKVSRDTLMESGLFRRQLSDRFAWAPEVDGSYFIDADPELFEHLLRFMRRPGLFPLFYDKAKGFDYNLYNHLEAEAEYFQIDALHDWIKEKNYIKAVEVIVDVSVSEGSGASALQSNQALKTHIVPRSRKVYICPRGINVHRGDKSRCGQACNKARGILDEYEEETYIEVVSIREHVEFLETVCRSE